MWKRRSRRKLASKAALSDCVNLATLLSAFELCRFQGRFLFGFVNDAFSNGCEQDSRFAKKTRLDLCCRRRDPWGGRQFSMSLTRLHCRQLEHSACSKL